MNVKFWKNMIFYKELYFFVSVNLAFHLVKQVKAHAQFSPPSHILSVMSAGHKSRDHTIPICGCSWWHHSVPHCTPDQGHAPPGRAATHLSQLPPLPQPTLAIWSILSDSGLLLFLQSRNSVPWIPALHSHYLPRASWFNSSINPMALQPKSGLGLLLWGFLNDTQLDTR
jgi:hypothetical protein